MYLKEDQKKGTKKIIKVFSEENYDFYKIETEVMQKYSIINFPILLDSFSEEGKYVIESEFVEGNTIFDEIKKNGTMKRDMALGILELVIRAILRFYSLSGHKYVFCDISPRNLILRKDGEISIVDLNSISKKGEKFKTASLSFSERGGFNERITNEKSDVYSIGKLYYFMLTGRTDEVCSRGLDKFSKNLIFKSTQDSDISDIDMLLKTIDPQQKSKKNYALFKRKIAIVGNDEFALEICYALKHLGYLVCMIYSDENTKLLNYFLKYSNSIDDISSVNPDIEIHCVKNEGELDHISYHSVFKVLYAYTHELDSLIDKEFVEHNNCYFVFFKYEKKYMLPCECIKKIIPHQKYFFISQTMKRKISYETKYFKYINEFKANREYKKVIKTILGEH